MPCELIMKIGGLIPHVQESVSEQSGVAREQCLVSANLRFMPDGCIHT